MAHSLTTKILALGLQEGQLREVSYLRPFQYYLRLSTRPCALNFSDSDPRAGLMSLTTVVDATILQHPMNALEQ